MGTTGPSAEHFDYLDEEEWQTDDGHDVTEEEN